jgi:cbb3-type cytochrome oxidase subunit 3
MNPEQLQSLAVLALAMVPVAVLWWAWIRMLD